MADVVFEWMLNRLTSDATVGDLTDGRIRKGHVSDKANPTYPMVTLARRLPGESDPDAPAAIWGFYAVAWSDLNYEQAFELAEAVRLSLHNADHYDETAGTGWYIKARTSPVEWPDESPATAYGCSVVFEVHQIGP